MKAVAVTPRKLIEVALPLDEINKACGREKSIRHGHPSTLHLWWARRPLAAARAVLFAQLVNDPSWKYDEDELRKPQIRSAITRKRNELFKLIGELVQWENTANPGVLARARAEIRASWKETCEANKSHPDASTRFDPTKPPALHDPFAGGGAIPLEGQRLGLEARASDLNPIAVLINKAMIEIPPRFSGRSPVGPIPTKTKQTKASSTEQWPGSRGLAEDVRRYGLWLREEAKQTVGDLYAPLKITKAIVKQRPDLEKYVGKEATPIAWIWARTVKSPNPAFAAIDVPLISTFWLAKKEGKETWLEPKVKGADFALRVRKSTHAQMKPELIDSGTKEGRGANFRCVMSGSPITPDYIKSEAIAGRMGQRLVALVLEGDSERIYLEPSDADHEAFGAVRAKWRPDFEMSRHPQYMGTLPYGITRFSQLFLERQLTAMTAFGDLLVRVRARVAKDFGASPDQRRLTDGGSGAQAYADAIVVYLALALDKLSESLSTVCTWSAAPKNELVVSTFRRQALSMTWDFAEANPFGDSSGSFEKIVNAVCKVIEAFPDGLSGRVEQANARTVDFEGAIVSTDPPYFDNVPYADLSDFFYVWARRNLEEILPELFRTILTPKAEELVADMKRHGGRDEAHAFFLEGMKETLSSIAANSAQAFPATIYYAFKQSDTDDDGGVEGVASGGWEAFLEAVVDARLVITGTWPVRTERDARTRGLGSNALASSIVLVCRPREVGASVISRRDFLRELERVLPLKLTDMIAGADASPLAPVDLAQASIGPGMSIFSKYDAVLEADGTKMSVHNALIHINKAIDDFFVQAEGDLDSDTRFCIGWFEEFGFETGDFGRADVLARAKGTSVDGVKEAGVVEAGRGKVRLLRIKDLPKAWDPTKDTRTPIWEACHHMCRALGDSEGDAGALLARMPEKQEAIRLLAYRLYTLCERKGWAEEARAYNELITSWAAIVDASQRAGIRGTQMELI